MKEFTVNIVEEIKNYLIKHPNAGDNRNGILHFWLGGIECGEDCIAFDRALDNLVAEGWLTEQRTHDGGTIYMSTAKVKRHVSISTGDSKL